VLGVGFQNQSAETSVSARNRASEASSSATRRLRLRSRHQMAR